jgi:hypothetical protein
LSNTLDVAFCLDALCTIPDTDQGAHRCLDWFSRYVEGLTAYFHYYNTDHGHRPLEYRTPVVVYSA